MKMKWVHNDCIGGVKLKKIWILSIQKYVYLNELLNIFYNCKITLNSQISNSLSFPDLTCTVPLTGEQQLCEEYWDQSWK